MLASPPACSVCLCITRTFLPEPGFGHRHVPALWHVLAGGERKDVAMFCAPLPVSGFGAFLKKTRESDILQRSSLWNLGLFWPLGQNLFLKMVFLIETFFFSFKLFSLVSWSWVSVGTMGCCHWWVWRPCWAGQASTDAAGGAAQQYWEAALP